jgi:hypothetical protein
MKILILNYGKSKTELLVNAINDGMINKDWRKRNSCVMLSEELISVIDKVFGGF